MTPTEISPGLVVNTALPALKLGNFKLIAFDMDSTLINIECVDEIADAAGRKAEVAAITEAPCAARSPTSRKACVAAWPCSRASPCS